MADTEEQDRRERASLRPSFYFGEGVTREVKRWFDRPPNSTAGDTNLSRPTIDAMNARKGSSTSMVPTDGCSRRRRHDRPSHYKLGVDRDGDGYDDIFDKPYRPEPKDMFVGIEGDPGCLGSLTCPGPDIRMDRARTPPRRHSRTAFRRRSCPASAGAAGVLTRIKSIEVYAPPYLDTGGGNWARFGVATVKTRVQILEIPRARRAGPRTDQ
jgi:hypothetical protein